MKSALNLKLFCIFIYCVSFCSFAAKANFVDSPNPPPGFELKHHSQHLRITLVLGNQQIGIFYIVLRNGQLEFQTPELILSRLNNIKSKKRILTLLKQRFPLNIECIKDARMALPENCTNLENEPVSIIYDPKKEIVYLSISASYFKKPKTHDAIDYIPDSTEKLSYINKLGATGSFNNAMTWSQLYTSLPNYYNLYSNNVFAYKNSSIVANLSQNNGINDGQRFQVQNLYSQKIDRNNVYMGGYLINPVSPFFQSQIIAGFAVKSTLDTIKNKESLSATPIVIFVPQASQVSIFKNEQLIFSQYLTAGYHNINTNGFPEGGYELTIKIGENNLDRRFFTKGFSLPPPQAPQYYVLGGYLTNGLLLNSNYTFLPNVLNIPVLQAGLNKRINQVFAFQSDILLNSKQGLLDLGPTFYIGNSYVKAAALIGSQNTYGAYLMFNTQLNRVNLNLIASRIFYQDPKNQYFFLNNLVDNDSVSLNYRITECDLIGVQANYTRTLFQQNTYNAGAYYQHMIGNYRGMNFFVNAGYNNSFFANQSYFLSLNINFTEGRIAGTESIALQNQNKIYSNNQMAVPVVLQGSTTYSHQNEVGLGYSANETHTLSPTVRSMAGIYDYTATNAFVSSYATYNHIRGEKTSLGYGGSFETELALNKGGASLNGVKRGNTAGILVKVDTDHSNDRSALFALVDSNNRKIAIIPANKKVYLSLPEFTDQNYTLTNLSSADYSIENATRHITLYPGNVGYYSWRVEKRLIVIGHLLKANNSLTNVWIHRGENGVFSDEEGYFQLELPLDTKILNVDEPISCQVKLPQLNSDKNYLYLGDVLCS